MFTAILLVIIALFLVFIECSNKFNTDNVLEKVSHALIFFGCLAALNGNQTDIILIGIALDFGSRILKCYLARKNRRASDYLKRKMQ